METRNIAEAYIQWDKYTYFFDSLFDGLSLQYDDLGNINVELTVFAREKLDVFIEGKRTDESIEKKVCIKLINIIEMKYRHCFSFVFISDISLRYQNGSYVVTFQSAVELDIEEGDWREQSYVWFVAENVEVMTIGDRV